MCSTARFSRRWRDDSKQEISVGLSLSLRVVSFTYSRQSQVRRAAGRANTSSCTRGRWLPLRVGRSVGALFAIKTIVYRQIRLLFHIYKASTTTAISSSRTTTAAKGQKNFDRREKRAPWLSQFYAHRRVEFGYSVNGDPMIIFCVITPKKNFRQSVSLHSRADDATQRSVLGLWSKSRRIVTLHDGWFVKKGNISP